MTFRVPNSYRCTGPEFGRLSSTPEHGNNGMFMFPVYGGQLLRCIASDGEGWEHVSASFEDRCPTWEEMCVVKKIFWGEDTCVVQFHPPKSEYVNHHPYCLHLWRRIGSEFETPPSYMVGPKS